jgi:hypothetical protein
METRNQNYKRDFLFKELRLVAKMTSWSVYVDEYLVGSGQVAHAAIFGVETKALWAKSADAEVRISAESFPQVGRLHSSPLLDPPLLSSQLSFDFSDFQPKYMT